MSERNFQFTGVAYETTIQMGGVISSVLILLLSLYLPLSLFSCKNDEDDDSPTYYTITISSTIENGSVEASKKSASSGESIKLTAKPATGYEFDSYSVTDSKGSAITVTNGEFKMPASNVTVSATFKESAAQKTAGSISYTTTTVSKTTTDSAFTNTLTNTGDGTVSYASSDTAVATVDASTGAVTIVAAGTTTITATVTDSDTYTYETKTASYTLTVTEATVAVTAITLNKTETEIKVGATETLSVTAVTPDNATDKTYTWKTSDASKATVTAEGVVTAVAVGTANITATANDGSGVTATCAVTVTPAVPEYYNKLTKINDEPMDQVQKLKDFGRGYESYNSSLTAAQAYALATYQAAIDGKPVYVIMSSQNRGYEIHYAVSTDAAATEHTADVYDICNSSNPVRMYYIAQ